jgi:hypothetical protein
MVGNNGGKPISTGEHVIVGSELREAMKGCKDGYE